MKNADTPAMPCEAEISNNNEAWAFQFDNGAKFKFPGITKREMFAMNAPDIPDWFVDEWIYNDGNYRLGGSHELVGNNRGANLDTTEMMKITKEWRYAYADLMLEE